MDHRINIGLAQDREREMHNKRRRRWPDDGLPARHKAVVRPSPHHPAALIAELFWR